MTKNSAREVKSDEGKSVWPGGARFALFLSHDIDQVYDRELFRILANVNHLRRIWTRSSPGNTIACLKRIGRAFVRPRPAGREIDTILAIERGFAYRSTFFLLEDPVFNRFGGRYRYQDPEVKAIARRIQEAGCEIAVHGAYHAFNDAEAYRKQAEAFRAAFGCESLGIRNHYLRHSGLATWRAQRQAGFGYDASFGSNGKVGIQAEHAEPFFPLERENGKPEDFVAVPLTIMDSALFGTRNWRVDETLEVCLKIATEVEAKGGVLSLLWHNECFDEAEYQNWERVYVELLDALARRRPWNATGAEIAEYWRRSQGKKNFDKGRRKSKCAE